jgi:Flp pilus assembly protein TadG
MSARRRRRTAGQSLVEFALVLPVFMSIIFGILDLGRAVWALDIANHAAAEAARFAIVHGGNANTYCPVGPPAATANIPAASEACPNPSPSKEMIFDVARKAAIGAGGTVTVTACYGHVCSGNIDQAGYTNARGTPVTVRVTIQVTIFTGALLGVSDVSVTGSATMTVSH